MPAGRKPTLTPERQELIVQALRAGNYQETAVQFANVGLSTYYTWLKRGAPLPDDYSDDPNFEDGPDVPDFIYREFREAVDEARAAAEIADLQVINTASRAGDWRAAAWKLERSHPTRWGRINRTEISGPQGGPVQVDHRAMLLDKLGIGADELDALSDDETGVVEDDAGSAD